MSGSGARMSGIVTITVLLRMVDPGLPVAIKDAACCGAVPGTSSAGAVGPLIAAGSSTMTGTPATVFV